MGPGDGRCDFVVHEPDVAVYNPIGLDPPVWEPRPEDIISMFQQLDSQKILPLTWVCPGRFPPPKESSDMTADFPSEEEDDNDEKTEERKIPEPSEFDFDDAASDTTTKMTPRTPVSSKTKRPERRMASMDNVLSSLRRQQKAEREARKGQGRSPGTSPFRTNASRMNTFPSGGSPVSRFSAAGSSLYASGSTPRMNITASSRMGQASGSPSASRSANSPSTSRFSASLEAPKMVITGSPLSMRAVSSPSNMHSFGPGMQISQSPRVGSPAAATSSPYLMGMSNPNTDAGLSAMQSVPGSSGSLMATASGMDVTCDPGRGFGPMTTAGVGSRPNLISVETENIFGDLGKT